MNAVTIRRATLSLPWYEYGRPDPEPPLLPGFGRQGLPIYPYPTIESFATRASARTVNAVVLENEYLRLTFLPALNARLYSLYDKLADEEVLFANPELKPALVAVRGVWHATGIELNFPSSHTVTTVDEIACEAWQDDSGAAHFVAWDVEAVSGLSWQCTTTLAPRCAAVTMRTRLANATDLPQRYYFWVNAAFPIRPGTRYVFPPSTRRIFQEGGPHPGEFGYLDYPVHDGVDIALFENLRHHAAHFAATPDEGFFGLHHPATDTGIAHLADPHLVCGRKVWSWGFAPDGQVWHDALTDTGGPYCEVQSGPLRSQVEYRSIEPGQELLQVDTWLPLRGLGGLSHASETVAGCWRIDDGELELRLLAAGELPGATVVAGDQTRSVDLGPQAATLRLPLPADGQVHLIGRDGFRHWSNVRLTPPPERKLPRLRAAREVTPGQRGRYLEWAGRLDQAREQYRHGAETEPAAAAALARFALARADSEDATRWAGRAMALDWHHPEALLVSALAARLAGQSADEIWFWEEMLGHGATRHLGQIGLIDLALSCGDYARAAARAEHLLAESADLRAFGRLAHALRHLGADDAVRHFGETAPFRVDPLLAAELWLAEPTGRRLSATAQLAAAATLHRLGDRDAALAVLAAESGPAPGTPAALLRYAAAWVRGEAADEDLAWPEGFAAGACAITVLRHAVLADENNLQAQYHLACALAAAGDWESASPHWAAVTDGPWAAEANRNLAVCAWQIHGDLAAAAAFYRHAAEWDAGPRTLAEQDRLLATLGRHEERLAVLRQGISRHPYDTRLPVRLVAAQIDAGQAAEALEVLRASTFHLYEGGSLPQQLWVRANLALAREREAAGDPAAAAEHYLAATEYPSHLGVGAPGENRIAEIWFRCGHARQAAGQAEAARAAWSAGATVGERHLAHAFPQRDRMPEAAPPGLSRGRLRNDLYRALCLQRLDRPAEATALLDDWARLVADRGGDATVTAWLDAVRHGVEPPTG